MISVFLFSCKKYDQGNDPCPVCPRITSISPTHGGAGAILNIYGKNFNSDYRQNIVKINGVQVSRDSIITGSSDSLTVFVPKGCGTGNVTIDIDDELTFSGEAPIFNYNYKYAVSNFAGNGTDSVINGIGNDASFSRPSLITVDQNDNLYVVDKGNSVIRKYLQCKCLWNNLNGICINN
ncbi:MAG: IPT/TIG domain-containing protein [Bacteroidetes bacterium]|nr:IPT/TIG domain-containing protein [Bacteroidota bacterium]